MYEFIVRTRAVSIQGLELRNFAIKKYSSVRKTHGALDARRCCTTAHTRSCSDSQYVSRTHAILPDSIPNVFLNMLPSILTDLINNYSLTGNGKTLDL